MEPRILDGTALAKETEYDLIERVERIVEETGKTPCLATILVGEDPSSVVYVRMKVNACARVGNASRKIELPEETTTEELLRVIETLSKDESVNGILLQHPVPCHINELRCFDTIAREKDVDGFNTASFGAIAIQERAFKSATLMAILRYSHTMGSNLPENTRIRSSSFQIVLRCQLSWFVNEKKRSPGRRCTYSNAPNRRLSRFVIDN